MQGIQRIDLLQPNLRPGRDSVEGEVRHLTKDGVAGGRSPRSRDMLGSEAFDLHLEILDAEGLSDHGELVGCVLSSEVARRVSLGVAAPPRLGQCALELGAARETIEHEVRGPVQDAAHATQLAAAKARDPLEDRSGAADRRRGEESTGSGERSKLRTVSGEDVFVGGDDVRTRGERRGDRRPRDLSSPEELDDDVRARSGRSQRISVRAIDRGDDLELVRQLADELEHTAADRAEAEDRHAQRRPFPAAARRESGGLPSDPRRMHAVESSELERDAAVASEPSGLVLHDRPVRRQQIREGRLGETTRRRSRERGIALVQPVDVLHETATRAEDARQEQGGEVGAAATEQHGPTLLVLADEARHDDDSVALQGFFEASAVDPDGCRIEWRTDALQPQGGRREDAR